MDRLSGRVAVVTGGASGIGLASVRRLASEGARVVVADLNADAGKRTADEVSGLFVATDVTDPGAVDRLFAAAHSAFGSVDIAFNNAGISPPDDDSILDTGLDAWRKVQEVNLTSVYLCCKAVIPYMRAQGKGSIINTASFVAVMGAATSQISYSASKGGVLSMTRELGVQFAREGIRVNALCPGPVLTPLLALLLARRGASVLVHGTPTEEARIPAAAVLSALGTPSLVAVRPLKAGELVYAPTGLLLPGLKRLLEVRRSVGLRNSAHSMVKLMSPCQGPSVLVSSYTHPEYAESMAATLALTGQRALLLRGTEGEVVADPRRTPEMTAYIAGQAHPWQEAQQGPLAALPELPRDISAASTANYIQLVLAGKLPVPAPIARQVEHILRLVEHP